MASPQQASNSSPNQPTENTPLSPQTTGQQRTYSSTEVLTQPQKHTDADDTSSNTSEESASGYVSGSGRRESVLESSRWKSHLSPHRSSASPSGRNAHASASAIASLATSPRGQQTPRSSALTWAFRDRERGTGNDAGMAQSPSAAYSPRMRPSLTDGAVPGPVPESELGQGLAPDNTAAAAVRRRSSKLKPSGSVSGGSRNASKNSKRTSIQADAEPDPDADEDSWAWFRNLADKYGAIELDNKGSVARDHLALERTFLAWLRTSLAFASIGIAITQLFRLNSTLHPNDPPATDSPFLRMRTVGKPLGTVFLGVAILILLIGWRRYFESQYWIIRGKFPASRGSVFLVTMLAAALIVGSLVIVVIVGRAT